MKAEIGSSRKPSKLNGQWLGQYAGNAGNGHVVLNIDELDTHYRGSAYLDVSDSPLPIPVALFRTANKDQTFEFRTETINTIDPVSRHILPWEQAKKQFSDDVLFPQYADVKGSVSDDCLTLSWSTDIGTSGECVLPRSKAGDASELKAIPADWKQFKEHVGTAPTRRFLFRGQCTQQRLRTSFHRTGRADIFRFMEQDILSLYRQLSLRTKHVFDLGNPDQYGAFFNLVQHHGYPTPLLDWTYSPYVAAFFAYRRVTRERVATAGEHDKVRIFIFDQEQWRANTQQSLMLTVPALHLSVAEFIAIENDRMIPQQALSTVTNVDDVESHIKARETDPKKTYLAAIDLPVSDRQSVMRELRYMGITAGSMFPGLDGACEELAERNFEV